MASRTKMLKCKRARNAHPNRVNERQIAKQIQKNVAALRLLAQAE